MNVSTILRKKGSSVETVRPEATVAEAAAILIGRRVGSLVVCATNGKLVGIVDERDIARGLFKHGRTVIDLPVEALMRRTVVTCVPEDDLKRLFSIMTTRRVRHLPVMVDHQLRGLVSIGDVVKHYLEEMQLEVNVLRDYARIRWSVW